MSKCKLVPAEPTLVAWVTADTVDGQAANGKPRRIWWENNEGVGMQIYAAPQQAPEVAKLVEALEEARLTLEVMQGRGSSVELTLAIIDRALTTYRKGGGQ